MFFAQTDFAWVGVMDFALVHDAELAADGFCGGNGCCLWWDCCLGEG